MQFNYSNEKKLNITFFVLFNQAYENRPARHGMPVSHHVPHVSSSGPLAVIAMTLRNKKRKYDKNTNALTINTFMLTFNILLEMFYIILYLVIDIGMYFLRTFEYVF